MKILFYVEMITGLMLFVVFMVLLLRRIWRYDVQKERTLSFELSVLFVVYGGVAVICLAEITPPYQVSDEIAHFFRADQVSMGQSIGSRKDNRSGGVVDSGISQSSGPFGPIVLHPNVKVTREMVAQAEQATWHQAKEFYSFENTSIYPPFFYIVSAAGVAIGKAVDLSVIDTLYLARLVNGLVAVGLGTVAIALAGSAAPWFFAVLTLPMTLAQMGSVSQDALMFPTAALAAALFIRLSREATNHTGDLALLTLLLALISGGRVTQATLGLLPLTLQTYPLMRRLTSAVVVFAAAIVWSSFASRHALVQFGLQGADSAGQVRLLISEPLRVFALAANTMRFQADLYLESFVGKLGWLDLQLPHAYHVVIWIELISALLISIGSIHRKPAYIPTILIALALSTSVVALFAALYISWTPVGNFIVDGIQGRYFIPLSFFVPALFTTRSPDPPVRRYRDLFVAFFPLLTIPVTIHGLIARYYLT